jgi:hypothetical protein
MPLTRWRERAAATIENEALRITVLREGGHVAEILHKKSGVNPLWVPPWSTIEPSSYDPAKHPEYGGDAEAKLLSGIHGHNLCLDLFGGPTPEEAAAGMTTHGEGSVAPFAITEANGELTTSATLPLHGLAFTRVLKLEGERVHFHETVENLTALDRPIAYTQHVTLGPPFLECGKTEFRMPGTLSMTYPTDFAGPNGYLPLGAKFDWPNAPRRDGKGTVDMRRLQNVKASAAFSTHLMDPHRDRAWFHAWSPSSKLLFGYEWKRTDFPWMGIWEENHSRATGPWNSRTLTRGMEFGASPFPESRKAMIERRELFGVPGYRWLPAKSKITVQYSAFARQADSIPEGH